MSPLRRAIKSHTMHAGAAAIRRQDAFADVLKKANVSVTIRREKGHDINAACGQLRLKTEESLAAEA